MSIFISVQTGIREKWKWEDVRARDKIQGHISVTTFQLSKSMVSASRIRDNLRIKQSK